MRLLPPRHVLALRQWRLDSRHKIDGTQSEYVRIPPFADTSLYHVPAGAGEDALVMLSDILPAGLECGVLNGKFQPGSTIAIVGAGPSGPQPCSPRSWKMTVGPPCRKRPNSHLLRGGYGLILHLAQPLTNP
jgi:hypothetical protein